MQYALWTEMLQAWKYFKCVQIILFRYKRQLIHAVIDSKRIISHYYEAK